MRKAAAPARPRPRRHQTPALYTQTPLSLSVGTVSVPTMNSLRAHVRPLTQTT